MIDKNFVFPLIFQKMSEKGYTNPKSDSYLWLNEMEWLPTDKIKEYEYDEGESRSVIPFAVTGGGDKWVWVASQNSGDDYAVGLCENAETCGVYYAKNTEDAILRQIIEYVSGSDFYIDKNEAESYQINEAELKSLLEKWKNGFKGIIKDEYISVIEKLSELNLKPIKSKYGEWYALLTLEEQDELIDKYIKFDLLGEEFEWYAQ